jgi:ribosome recycling factor
MKELDKVYEQKLFELKQMHTEVKNKIKNFKQNQQTKIIDIRRLFNSKLNKQINFEQLNRMKTTVEQLHKDVHQFQTNQCSISVVNNDKMNYFYKPNIEIQFKNEISDEYDLNQGLI